VFINAAGLFAHNSSIDSTTKPWILDSGTTDHIASLQVLFAHNSSIDSTTTKPWILDSGATDHIACDSQFFTHTSSSFIPNVNLSTYSTATISSTSTIKFNGNIFAFFLLI